MSGAVAVTTAVVAIGVAAAEVTTFAVVAAVGATVGAVGALTGVKELQYAGAALGAVGLVGGLATATGLIGAADVAAVAAGTTAAETASPFFSGVSGIDAEIAAWSSYGAGQAAQAASPAMDTVSAIVNPASGTVGTPVAASSPAVPAATANATEMVSAPNSVTRAGLEATQSPVTGDIPNVGPPGGGVASPAPATSSVAPPPVGSPSAPAVTTPSVPVTGETSLPGITAPSANPLDAGLPGSYGAATKAALQYGTVAADGSSATSPWADIMKWVGKNQTLVSGALMAGGSFLSGATSTLTPAQVKALEAQAEANRAAARLADIQANNMQSSMPVARRTGLINQPRVTGTVS